MSSPILYFYVKLKNKLNSENVKVKESKWSDSERPPSCCLKKLMVANLKFHEMKDWNNLTIFIV